MCGTLCAPPLSALNLPRIPLRFAHRNTRLRIVWCALRTIAARELQKLLYIIKIFTKIGKVLIML